MKRAYPSYLKVVFLVIAVIEGVCSMTGCTPVMNIPIESSFTGIDFRKYTELGFLITPEKYEGEYESIGLVEYTIIPEANFITVYEHQNSSGKWNVEEISLHQGLDSLYYACNKMGANAIVNFTAVQEVRNYNVNAKPLTIYGLKFSGFAIRRK